MLFMALSWRRERMLNAAKLDLYRKTVEGLRVPSPEPPKSSPEDEDVEAAAVAPDQGPDGEAVPDKEADEDLGLLTDIYHVLQRHMDAETAVYDPDFSIITLAEKTGFTRQQISRAVNAIGGKNFSTFVGEYRVREACRRLLEPGGEKMLIKVLSEEVGYRSRSHFSKIFRDTTGLSVTDFAKQARRQRLASECRQA